LLMMVKAKEIQPVRMLIESLLYFNDGRGDMAGIHTTSCRSKANISTYRIASKKRRDTIAFD